MIDMVCGRQPVRQLGRFECTVVPGFAPAACPLLQKNAKPFVDTPNDVLRRLLGLEVSVRQQGIKLPPPAPSATPSDRRRTPESAFRVPILEMLLKMHGHGHGHAADVLDGVLEKMRPALSQIDFETLSSGMPRWRNVAMWERKRMVDDGLINPNSRKGYWELTERGMEQARKLEKERSV